ncbi:sulfurtransferase [Streptomyces alkaliphilus]|uniref:Sulfurtransferase n=1 Tax=Streptomyces alkaliphilus TaxID=1472722 RepID=A0A7W3Y2K1_9ACTN|nr:sulfurtransferase [Streptomyces alkaliphilus]MBB0245425.1 sulfurtransferase [Streptomyces alkaliphilus]
MTAAIISPDELAAVLADPHTDADPPVLLDVRWNLGGPPGREEYGRGHLPGAVWIDLETELAGSPGPTGRHPLPSPDVLRDAMRRAGVNDDSRVVVYDGGQGWAAARAWWLLRHAGHEHVRVLDGGLARWNGPLATVDPNPRPGNFTPRYGAMPVLDAEGAARLARDGILLDARAPERYRGENEPIDPAAGHIPGARSAPTASAVGPDGALLPADELAARFTALGVTPTAETGVYCGSGVSAAQQVLALSLVGVRAALYPGSWSEWCADPSRPVAVGPEPG